MHNVVIVSNKVLLLYWYIYIVILLINVLLLTLKVLGMSIGNGTMGGKIGHASIFHTLLTKSYFFFYFEL